MISLPPQFSSLAQRTWIPFVLCWAVAVGYLATLADEGWIPHDEGMLGQCAERLLQGELPHRDFDEPYTGGLTWLHAASFRLFGLQLTSMRWILLAFSTLFVAALYRLTRRFAGPWLAVGVTWLAVSWSLPVYFAGLPSWYNLFFATFGILAFLKHLETGASRWLAVAGFWAGASCVIKPIGLYDVAGGLLFLLYREQVLTAKSTAAGERPPDSEVEGALVGSIYRGSVLAGLLGLLGLVVFLVSRTPRPMELLHFVLPFIAICGYLGWHEIQLPAAASHGARWRRMTLLLTPFLAGLGLPVGIFLVPYLTSGSLGDLLYGVFVLPQRRFEFASTPLTDLSTLWPMLPAGAVMVATLVRPTARLPRVVVGVVAVLGVGLLAYGHSTPIYLAVWHSVRPLVPVLVVVGTVVLRRSHLRLSEEARQRLFLLVAMLGMLSLVQYPESFYIYFAYVAPIAVLAWLALWRSIASEDEPAGLPGLSWAWLHATILAFYLLFPVLWQHHSLPLAMGQRYWAITNDTPLAVDRGGLHMPRPMAKAYEELVRLVRQNSAEGSYIYATPDCPEVYFLSGRRNPTRTFFDFFEPDYLGDPRKRSARLLNLLEARQVDVVVFCTAPQFSPRSFPALTEQVEQRYPNRAEVPTYIVHWRARLQRP